MTCPATYWVYMVRCVDGTLYTGIATDVDRRLDEHNGARPRGARYTAARRPVTLVWRAAFATRAQAAREEFRIKQLSRHDKARLIAAD